MALHLVGLISTVHEGGPHKLVTEDDGWAYSYFPGNCVHSILLNVSALEQIRQMPLQEKLLVMEAIWDDICRDEENLEVPQWHKEVLDERERLIADGKAQFIEWEEAKKQINATYEGLDRYRV